MKLAAAPDLSASASQAVADALAAFHDALTASFGTACAELENAGAAITMAADDFAVNDRSVSDIVATFADGLL